MVCHIFLVTLFKHFLTLKKICFGHLKSLQIYVSSFPPAQSTTSSERNIYKTDQSLFRYVIYAACKKLDKNIIVAFGSSNPLQAANCCHKSRLVADEDELKCVAKGKQISLLLK